ncbi:hypothetical protein SPHINGO391_90005 [Sphingomonas aurantiaca]|uniref:Uncharacterized protein n=1 Tax=Sphingomonas aurantiaca TaxID=185949 RepID=A0A5E8ASZ3_9SPHN|nr:hypothetical protein SPHINGO391_90005 [Sphingomonas aurantiaca]
MLLSQQPLDETLGLALGAVDAGVTMLPNEVPNYRPGGGSGNAPCPDSCAAIVIMRNSQVLHHAGNGGNPGTSVMHISDAQRAHDLRLCVSAMPRLWRFRPSAPAGRHTGHERGIERRVVVVKIGIKLGHLGSLGEQPTL